MRAKLEKHLRCVRLAGTSLAASIEKEEREPQSGCVDFPFPSVLLAIWIHPCARHLGILVLTSLLVTSTHELRTKRPGAMR